MCNVYFPNSSPRVWIYYIFLCLTKEHVRLDSCNIESLILRFKVLLCLLLEFPCDLNIANVPSVTCAKMTSVHNLLHVSHEYSGMLIHAHIPTIPLIFFLGIISVQDSPHSLLSMSIYAFFLDQINICCWSCMWCSVAGTGTRTYSLVGASGF